MALAEEYVAALEKLGKVFDDYTKVNGQSPVLVGGAAAAIYTDGQFPSGDFDVVAGNDQLFDKTMIMHGFIKERRKGKLKIGFYHPDHPQFGYQQVTGPLFDGRSDREMLVRITLREDRLSLVLPSIEDMIADRLGQHAVASPTDESRLHQARALFKLAERINRAYLLKRISDEQGDPALLGL